MCNSLTFTKTDHTPDQITPTDYALRLKLKNCLDFACRQMTQGTQTMRVARGKWAAVEQRSQSANAAHLLRRAVCR